MSRHFTVAYSLALTGGTKMDCSVKVDEESMLSEAPKEKPPEWARLEKGKCEGCTQEGEYCPVALRLAPPIRQASALISHDRVTTTVTTAERAYVKEDDVQNALRSLFGLIMATSGCPTLKPFRYMARFHLPFSTIEETISRVTASYLIGQMFHHEGKDTLPFAVAEVEKIYAGLQTINAGMAKRLRGVVEQDGALNAIVILSCFSSLIPVVIADELKKIEHLFD